MIDKDQSDSILIKRYISGNKLSLQLLVKKWHSTFCKKAFWVVRDKELAKDIAQECWMIIIKNLSSLKNTESFKSWALRIVYTKSIDAHNRRLKELKKIKNLDNTIYDAVAENETRFTKKSKLLRAINNLSDEQQSIIRLFYVQEYSIKEIGVFLNIPIGTVKSRLFTAREKLKSIIKS